MPAEHRTAHEPDLDFDRLPVLSQVESDRFCEGCGYNLRTQGVRRDPRLNILVVRCPECNRYHPVSTAGTLRQIWWQRLASLLTIGYVVFLLSLVFGLGGAEMACTALTLDELSRYTYDATYTQRGPRLYELPNHPDYRIAVGLGTGSSLLAGWIGVALGTTLFHHWRRWAYVVYAAAIPGAVAIILYALLLSAPHEMADFAYHYVACFAGLQVAGGLLAVPTGRPVARVLVRLLLPLSLRANLAPLWSADGLQPPRKPPRSPI